MNFWLRNIIIGVIIIVLAGVFFTNQDFFLGGDESVESTEQTAETSTEEQSAEVTEETADENSIDTKEKVEEETKEATQSKPKASSNAAADGLSKFYASIYGDMGGDGPEIRNNIVYLPDPEGNLTKILQNRERDVRPYSQDWQGTTESRPFRPGDTLSQKLIEYTKKEDIKLIWWINRDYVVKDAFRVRANILRTAFQVSKAIEGHFESGLSVFFCNRQRAIVLIKKAPQDFLDEECRLLKTKNQY